MENTESEAPDIVRFAQRDSAALNEICVSAGRDDDVLDDGDIVLVHGVELGPAALRYSSIYEISVFAVRGATLEDVPAPDRNPRSRCTNSARRSICVQCPH